MTRIPDRYFPHRVKLRPIDPLGSSLGPTYLPEIPNVLALVIPKSTQRTDGRDGETRGTLVAVSTHVFMQPESHVQPGSLVVLYPGTAHEETVTVVSSALFEHPRAPESAQVWTV